MNSIRTPPRFHIPEWLIKLIYTRQLKERSCAHLDLIKVRKPSANRCEECIALGDTWPNLRMCLVCGYVGCCDTSKNKHMKKHVGSTGHPLIRTIEPGEGWIWCYEDNAFLSADSPQLDQPMPR
jgi:uncharacterized UBP type Zn finger protein